MKEKVKPIGRKIFFLLKINLIPFNFWSFVNFDVQFRMNLTKDPCKKYACLIQKCLKSNNYNEDYCIDAIENMKKCCIKWNYDSDVCDGFLKQLGFNGDNKQS